MQRTLRLVCLLFAVLLLFGCGNAAKPEETVEAPTAPPAPPETPSEEVTVNIEPQRTDLPTLPPTPTPTTIGGQGFPPASNTVSRTNFLTPSLPSAGMSILTEDIFSLPPPFGATSIRKVSPGTSLILTIAGVLSAVFFLSRGWRTTDFLKYPPT